MLHNFMIFQPLVRFRRIARLVRILCGVCRKLRGYAIEAGYLENYMVEVTGRRVKGGNDDKDENKDEEEEVLTFDPKEFRIRHDVSFLVYIADNYRQVEIPTKSSIDYRPNAHL